MHLGYLLLGFLWWPGSCKAADPCATYKVLSAPWRNVGFDSTSFSAFPMCDCFLFEQSAWFRFEGIVGDVMPEKCVPGDHCGGFSPANLGFSHPLLGEGIKQGATYASWSIFCNFYSLYQIKVLACPGGYYVYSFPPVPYYVVFSARHSNCSEGVCGPLAECTPDGGCVCNSGFAIPAGYLPTGNYSYGCEDIDECTVNKNICGTYGDCNNTVGGYLCICHEGFANMPNDSHVCQDIDECTAEPAICGPNSMCNNTIGSYNCSCLDGYLPSTLVIWQPGVTFCQNIQEQLNNLNPPAGQSPEMFLLHNINRQLSSNPNIILPVETVTNILSGTLSITRSIAPATGDGNPEAGSALLNVSEKLVSAMVEKTSSQYTKTVRTSDIDCSVLACGPKTNGSVNPQLTVKGNVMSINLSLIAENNNGSAAVIFMFLGGMDTLLMSSFFSTENVTQMYSDIITATLPKTNISELPEPVNFTLSNKGAAQQGVLTCVYWAQTEQQWSTEGCSTIIVDENNTMCSCSHLSTFALILQTHPDTEQSSTLLDWVNRICVCVGLFFLALACLTFQLCSWNPKVNNTARLHLCLCLFIAQLLFLVGVSQTQYRLLCAGIAGVLHFTFLASFVWMFLETLQLFLLVKSLSKVQVIHREGLKKPYLYLIGYGIPTVVVGVSVGVRPSGYGGPNKCWLQQDYGLIYSFIGPVAAILAINCLLFFLILWTLRPTLINMKSDISQAKDTRLIVFKIVAQFIILGCAWIVGFYQNHPLLQYLFILLNSQQGTFIYIVHCLFNREVREEYVKAVMVICQVDKPPPSRQPSVCGNTVDDSLNDGAATEKSKTH